MSLYIDCRLKMLAQKYNNKFDKICHFLQILTSKLPTATY